MTLGSLFDGISGFPLAASWCGIETKWISEIDTYCLKVSKKNFPNAKQYGNIKELFNPEYVDIVSGGFPCQPFSLSGSGKCSSDDRYLWPEMSRVIQEVKPRWVVAENVFGLVVRKKGVELEKVCIDLEGQGYEVQSFIIPACSVGGWHKRDRVWIIGRLNEGSKGYGLFSEVPEHDTHTFEQRPQGQAVLEAKRQSLPTESFWTDHWLEVAAKFRGMDDGLPRKLDRSKRLEALGNAIVPQVAYEIFKAIVAIEESLTLTTKTDK